MHLIPITSELPKTLAYLDPGSGSLIIQMLIAAVVGIGFFFRAFWGKLFGKKNEQDDIDDSDNEEDHQS